MQTAVNFAQKIRKMPIRCDEAPGFVVNRILNSAASEIWRHKAESGFRPRRSTRRSPTPRSRRWARSTYPTCWGSTPCCTSPSTCRLVRRPLLRLARDAGAGRGGQLRAEDRQGLLRARGELEHGTGHRTADRNHRRSLHAEGVRRACLVLQEGVASSKDIEIGMMTGAGILPGPFARADERGPDETLDARAGGEEWGRVSLRHDPAPPRRSGKAGPQDRPGILPLPAARRREGDGAARDARRGGSDLAQPPRQPHEPGPDQGVHGAWKHCNESSEIRSVVIASTNIFTFSAGADIKEFTKMDASGGAGLLDLATRCCAR